MQTDFNSSRLVRLLASWMPAEAGPGHGDVAQRLGDWLGAIDAVALHAAHQSMDTLRAERPAAPARGRSADLPQELQRVRAALARAVADSRIDEGSGYSPWRQRHAELQRQMEQALDPLRGRIRQAMNGATTGLRQLAALDAVLEQTLGGREQRLLAMLPALLAKRHGQLREAGQLERFGGEWQEALLAELEVRLQPLEGLIDAWTTETRRTA